MECHDAKFLLTFARRKCENLAPAERAALDQHLDACPDCAAFASAERRSDATFSKVMQDVPVPADLAQKVMKRLAQQRSGGTWKWLATAAALLLSASALSGWYFTQPTEVTVAQVIEYVDYLEPFRGMPREEVDKYFANEGLRAKAPIDFDYDYLQDVEIVSFRNKRVGKLYFRRQLGNGISANAYVLVLPRSEFRVDQLPGGQLNHATTIEVKHTEEFTYLIYHRGNLHTLRRPNIAA